MKLSLVLFVVGKAALCPDSNSPFVYGATDGDTYFLDAVWWEPSDVVEVVGYTTSQKLQLETDAASAPLALRVNMAES